MAYREHDPPWRPLECTWELSGGGALRRIVPDACVESRMTISNPAQRTINFAQREPRKEDKAVGEGIFGSIQV